MTAFSDADLDLLADFVGGALDGTPAADGVRHLVSTDVQWAEAYTALVTADAAVRDELHALGQEPELVPLELQQRLDAALAAAVGAPPADAPVVDLARARQARRQRRTRWAVGLAAAAAVLVCGGVGVQALRQDLINSGRDTASSGDYAPPKAAAPSPAQVPNAGAGEASDSARTAIGGASRVLTSGRDYAPDTVGQAAQSAPSAFSAPSAPGQKSNSLQEDAGGGDLAASVPGPLSRLGDPAARAACLAAITGEYGGAVALVDYARFEGDPVLVVVVDGARVGAGRRLVVVVGPTCGIGGAIADERFRTTAP